MVDTKGTVPPVQLLAYGCLLLAMAIFTAESVRSEGKLLLRWLTFAYIMAFSMSIPVVYAEFCGSEACVLCRASVWIQPIVSVGPVAVFGATLRSFFLKKAKSTFCIYGTVG